MAKEISPSQKAINLLGKAWKAKERAFVARDQGLEEKFKQESSYAIVAIDEAIATLEKAGLDPYFYKAQKEVLIIELSPGRFSYQKDFSGLCKTMEEALKDYEEQHNIVQQVETHLVLTGIYIHANEKQKASEHLKTAEILISKIKSGEIDPSSLETNLLPMETFLQLRQAEVERLTNYTKD